MAEQALVFLTHVYTPRIRAHFERLKSETNGLVDCFLCLHRPTGAHTGDNADFIITEDDERAFMGHRLEYRLKHKLPTGTCGFLDLIFLSAVQCLPNYAHYYMCEFDVDYSGNWRDFFARTVNRDGDLLASHIHRKPQNKNWCHWTWHFNIPPRPDEKLLMAQIVLMRMSRRLIDTYIGALRTGKYIGNLEALVPTIALEHGLSIADFGFDGEFTPPEWKGKNYTGDCFRYRPVLGDKYWGEDPAAPWFAGPDLLHHPIKVPEAPSAPGT